MHEKLACLLKAPYRAWWRRQIRPRTVDIPLDQLLQGGECGIAGARYSRLVDDPRRTSRLIDDWPHTRLLRDFERSGEAPLETSRLRESAYWKNAAQCIEHTGRYFSAKTEAGIPEIARNFIARAFPGKIASNPAHYNSAEHSGVNSLPVVSPIHASNFYQIEDGHHRAAVARIRGERTLQAQVLHWPVKTRLQELLLDVVWQQDRAELYQPVDYPEFNSWLRVRQCQDRLDMMLDRLTQEQVKPVQTKYLDVGSSYGWFVAQMGRKGFVAKGVELDRFAAILATPLYGAPTNCITRSEAVRFLQSTTERHDIVSCFSVLHHFALGKGSVDAVDFINLLARVTGKILFIDTGESHERWFKESLADWTPEYIETWLRRHTDFRTIVRLGRDHDAVGQFADAYGRTLFACIR